MTKRQFCAGCLRTVEDYRTLVYDGARRFHFCGRRDCQRQYQAGVHAGAIKLEEEMR